MQKATIFLVFVLTCFNFSVKAQHIDSKLSENKMKKDLKIFKQIRQQANSGLYKYRTPTQIDSIYLWAENQILQSTTYGDFYNIICRLTDYEGSLHNDTQMSSKVLNNLKKEQDGYFPYPIKLIENKWVINFENAQIPVGSQIIAINQEPIDNIISNTSIYYTTDGLNQTGKQVGMRSSFSKYYRLYYGLHEDFQVEYQAPNTSTSQIVTIKSVSYKNYYDNVSKMYSMPYDKYYYADLKDQEKYHFEQIDSLTAKLTIHSFDLGNANSASHKDYMQFLDNTFKTIKESQISNLIVDVRNNGGGNDPNDIMTYSFLANRDFQESKQVWISFNKIPFIKYIDSPIPKIIRPFGIGKYNKLFQKRFPIKQGDKYFIGENESEMQVITPNPNAFKGNVYLLISEQVASAASLFAALLAGNENTITIGNESMGGYFGHNGHTPISYVLPHSKIVTTFSVDNITQDVLPLSNQLPARGIIPQHLVLQSYEDFINQKDTQLDFTMKLIQENN